MRELRAICLLCRARLSAGAGARREPTSLSLSLSLNSFESRSPARGWSTPARFRSSSSSSRATDAVTARRGSAFQEDASSLVETAAAASPAPTFTTPRSTTAAASRRRRRPRQTDDAALAVFRDIVDSQQSGGRGRNEGFAEEQGEGEGWSGLDEHTIQQALERHDEQKGGQQSQQQQGSVGRPLSASMDLYQSLIKLAQLRSQADASPATLFTFFEDHMYPHMAHLASGDLPNIFRTVAQQIVRDVSAAKQRELRAGSAGSASSADGNALKLPSVARITEIRRQLDLLVLPQSWAGLVLDLVRQNLAVAQGAGQVAAKPTTVADTVLDAPTAAPTAASTEKHKLERGALLRDLVEAWRAFCLPDIVAGDPDAFGQAPADEFRLPAPDPLLLAKYARQRNLHLALSQLFPRYAPRQLRGVTAAVVATHALLTDPAMQPSPGAETAGELLQAVAAVLAAVPVDRQTAGALFVSQPDVGAYVLTRWPLVAQTGASAPGADTDSTATAATAMTPHQAGPALAMAPRRRQQQRHDRVSFDGIHKQLSQALRARNLAGCEAAWERFWTAVSAPDAEGAAGLRASSEMFDYFIMAFTTMRMPERAIGVWNLMVLSGVAPTLRTWTSFMEGCKLASNATGIHNIWAKLMASGLPVDTAVWTARISGLIQAGDADAGIRALEEMQQTWEAWQRRMGEASAGTVGAKTPAAPAAPAAAGRPTAVQPTIEPVNAAIAGVLRRGDMGAARSILAWAGRHGIEPDRITFNTILRPLVRSGRGEEVAGVLEMMRQREIAPDEATVTILLEGVLDSGALDRRAGTGTLSASVSTSASAAAAAATTTMDQVDVIRRLLADVEAAGLEANHQTYAKMVYLLLQAGADAAAEEVLLRMRARGLPLSAHIYTILAEHYLSRSPPDLAAVEALIEAGQSQSRQGSGGNSNSNSNHHHHHSHHHSPFDRVFWERVVRGYAQAGDTKNALRHFAHIADSLAVTASTLEDLLRALLRNGERDAAAQLVARVQAQKMLLVRRTGAVGPGLEGGVADNGSGSSGGGGGADPRLFRHRFWHLAAEHGLLQM